MEYIIIGILILLVVLVTISLFKNINEGNITERLGKLENNVTRDLYDFKNDILIMFEKVNITIDNKWIDKWLEISTLEFIYKTRSLLSLIQ